MWAVAMPVVDLSFPIRPHFRWTVASERRSSHEMGVMAERRLRMARDPAALEYF